MVYLVGFFCSDLEHFLNDGLKGENLSRKAKEKRDAFIKRIKEVKLGYVYLHCAAKHFLVMQIF